jgi:hypothetical protein
MRLHAFTPIEMDLKEKVKEALLGFEPRMQESKS